MSLPSLFFTIIAVLPELSLPPLPASPLPPKGVPSCDLCAEATSHTDAVSRPEPPAPYQIVAHGSAKDHQGGSRLLLAAEYSCHQAANRIQRAHTAQTGSSRKRAHLRGNCCADAEPIRLSAVPLAP